MTEMFEKRLQEGTWRQEVTGKEVSPSSTEGVWKKSLLCDSNTTFSQYCLLGVSESKEIHLLTKLQLMLSN